MSMELDQSLDAIIASKPKGGIRKRRSRVSKPKAPKANKPSNDTASTIKSVISEESKIIVSNLPADVTEPQVRELFVKSIGPCKRVSLAYGPNGRSKGIATVIFSRPGDATRAYEQYEGRVVDGTRKMKVEIILDPSRQLNSLAARVAPAKANTSSKPKSTRRRNIRRGKGNSRPKKSAEELDKEMDDYFGSNTENKNDQGLMI
ncbi:RNA binding protein Mlo3 [Schizosaccharomyces cryophilus OY26]|uniref:RNA binding protein Mlo3 n=1 Tax=Schizosaccharomyces cryophilus (strain OY26 / ATCC MYA-4695 / CBS 11777 / NBRC 106824 / NRRL Y48691) TaxID=653667 RepID=S9X788_SCHCR|nr:RNA binding protein Mlo3 [Schizosaccharomyces cryophilus OY26]EPY52952.1 RNA binding protein Mlo3 [Schizosaccharomyces cryophilus OY26]